MSYKDRFRRRLDAIQAGAWGQLEQITVFPPEAARGILGEILETGCLSQNAANICLAREALTRLPGEWLRENLPGAVNDCLFRKPGWEEWEFRRLAEMLEKPFPELLAWWIDCAHQRNDPEIEEAINDYIKQEE